MAVRLSVAFTAKDVARFEKRLVTDPVTGCQLWTGSRGRAGYGQFQMMPEKRPWLAHRIAWLFAGMEIPADKPFLLHTCPGGDNPSCCNVDHLRVGTPADNSRDNMIRKTGRKGAKGLPRGVYVAARKFASAVRFYGQHFYFGVHPTAEEAGEISAAAYALHVLLPHLFAKPYRPLP